MPGLTITRKEGESFRVGNVTITLLDVDVFYRRAVLNIIAPRDIAIVRSELEVDQKQLDLLERKEAE